MIRVFYLLLFLSICSCREDKPYKEFEDKLVNAICKCISLKNDTPEENFLNEYQKCTKNTSDLLQTGLDHYPEDARLSKEAYRAQLPELIKQLRHSDRCGQN